MTLYAQFAVEEETVTHLFNRCELAKEVWKLSPLRITKPKLILQDFFKWWASFNRRLANVEEGELVASMIMYICWHIWRARNEWVFEKKKVQPYRIVIGALKELYEYVDNEVNSNENKLVKTSYSANNGKQMVLTPSTLLSDSHIKVIPRVCVMTSSL